MAFFGRRYMYRAPNGKWEYSGIKMAPAELRRANVPAGLVKAYENVMHEKRAKLIPRIEKYLEKQESFQFGHVDLEIIAKLLASDAKVGDIAYATKMSRTKVAELKECPPKVTDLSVLEAIHLTEYAENYKLDQGQEDVEIPEIDTSYFDLSELISNSRYTVENSEFYYYGSAGIALVSPAIGLLFNELYSELQDKSSASGLLKDCMQTYVAKTGSVYFCIHDYTVRISNHPSYFFDDDYESATTEKGTQRIFLSKNF